jgi:hypothetical protein
VALGAASESGITSLNVGVAGGAVAVNVVGYGNDITSSVSSTVANGSVIDAGGAVAITAENAASISALGIGVGAGAVGVGVMAAGNLIIGTVDAKVDASEVTSGTTLDITALSDAKIMALTGGVAAGGVGVHVAFSGNFITGLTTAEAVSGSKLHAGEAMTIQAENSSVIDALSFGVAAGGVGVGVALSANVIVNTTEAQISGSTITGDSSLSVLSESSAVIRALALNVGAGGVAVNIGVLGNMITSDVRSTITDSAVTIDHDILVSAQDQAPSSIPDWIIPEQYKGTLSSALDGSPIDLDANILAVNVSVAGGGVAASGALTGNVILNTVQAEINDAEVTSNDGSVASGRLQFVRHHRPDRRRWRQRQRGPQYHRFRQRHRKHGGRVHQQRFSRHGRHHGLPVRHGLLVHHLRRPRPGGFRWRGHKRHGGLQPHHQFHHRRSVGIEPDQYRRASLLATSEADILSFVGGVAGSGLVAAQLSLTINEIENTIRASIVDDDAGGSTVTAGSLSLSAVDASTIDSVAMGLAASGFAAGGAAVSKNLIANEVSTEISGSDVISSGAVSLDTRTSDIIRSYAIGVAGAGLGAANASLTLNDVGNTVTARIKDSTIEAVGDVSVMASETTPSAVPDFYSTVGADPDMAADLDSSLDGNSVNPHANIVSFAGSITVGGYAALGAAVADNSIHGTVTAEIVDSTVTSTGGSVTAMAASEAAIASLAAGFGVSAGLAINASAVNNTIGSTTEAVIRGASTVFADGNVTVSASDTARIDALAFSLSGGSAAVGGAVVVNSVANTTLAHVSGTSASQKAVVSDANLLTVSASSDYAVSGRSLGANLGGVAAGASVVSNTVGGATSAYIGDHAEIGVGAVGAVSVTSGTMVDAVSEAYGLAGGILAGGVNSANGDRHDTAVDAHIGDADVQSRAQSASRPVPRSLRKPTRSASVWVGLPSAFPCPKLKSVPKYRRMWKGMRTSRRPV